jgi:L-aminopeptidase/D-esterase-like protein
MADAHYSTPAGKPRARALGIPFEGTPGPWNAITDVPGVEVGHVTLIEGEDVRTGITAIHPRGRAEPADPCVAGFHSQNGQGEMTGVHWVQESGTFSGPIALTSTHAIGTAHNAIVRWTARHHPQIADGWLLPVVAETWDGYVHDINGGHLTEEHAVEAFQRAASGPLEEGSVGGGTGMVCYGFKGGFGTASRTVAYAGDTFTVGVAVQANFGARPDLTIAGIPLGQALADDNPVERFFAIPAAGSVLVIVATDAPLLPDQCRALARRVTAGLSRTGSSGDHFSGDLFLAFSVANAGAITPEDDALRNTATQRYDQLRFIPWGYQDPLNKAVAEATEEAVLDAIVANDEMVGYRGRRVPGLPRERVQALIGPVLAVRDATLADGQPDPVDAKARL